MLFRVHIAVIRAVQSEFSKSLPVCERDLYDAIACTFGVNAPTIQEAVQIAVTAASAAVDRNGEFIGGIPVEVNCRSVDRSQFDGYEKHFHNPITQRGIFYVSGTTSYWIQRALAADTWLKLEEFRERIKHSGLPKPSFVHPQTRPEPPSKVRLLCSKCEHWVEVDNEGLIFSFMEGLNCFSKEEGGMRRRTSLAGHFLSTHLSDCKANIVGIHEDDPRWTTLDDERRDSQAS